MGGSMGGHVLQGLAFLALGAWHLVSFFAAYARAPREYAARAWYPASAAPGARLKHLELHLMLLFLPLAIFYDLGTSTTGDGGAAVGGLDRVTTLVMFWLFALVALVGDTTAALPFPPEGPFLFAGVAFGLEWMSLQNGGDGGLERRCNGLLAYAAAACALSSGMLALRPRAFLAHLVLCLALLLHGTWQFQMALSLHSDRFLPLGCRRPPAAAGGAVLGTATQCDVADAAARAAALMDFAFNCHVVAVVFAAVLAFGAIAKLHGHRRGGGGYDPLAAAASGGGIGGGGGGGDDFDAEPAPHKLSFERR